MESLVMRCIRQKPLPDGTYEHEFAPDQFILTMFRTWMKKNGWVRFFTYEQSEKHKTLWDEHFGATIVISLTNSTCEIFPHSAEEEKKWRAGLEAEFGPMMCEEDALGYGF